MKSQSQMILLLFVGYAFVYLDKTVTGFALLPIEKEFGLSTSQLGLITGVFFLAYSLFQIPAGWLNDRIGYKTMLLLSLSMLGLCAILFGALGASFGLLLLFRFLAGVGHSGYPCSCAKAVVSNFSVEKRTFAQSVLLSSAGLAMTVGPIVAVAALSHLGWHRAFITLGVLACVMAGLMLLRVPAPVAPAKAQAHGGASGLWRNPTVLLLFVAIFCVNIPSYGLMSWLPRFLVDGMGMPMTLSGYIFAVGGAGMWCSSLCTGWLVGKYFFGREPQAILVCATLSAAAILGIFYATTALAAGILLFVCEIFLMATFVTLFTLPMKRLPENVMGAAMGFINTGGTLGGFISPIVIGFLLDRSSSYQSTFIFLAASMLCAGVAVLPLMRRKTSASVSALN